MFQPFATGANNSKLWVLDQQPDSNVSVEPNGRRWQPGDPSPVRLQMDYHDGVEACQRNPLRYRAEQMSDADYQALLTSRGEMPR